MENRYLCRGKRIDIGEWVHGLVEAQDQKGHKADAEKGV